MTQQKSDFIEQHLDNITQDFFTKKLDEQLRAGYIVLNYKGQFKTKFIRILTSECFLFFNIDKKKNQYSFIKEYLFTINELSQIDDYMDDKIFSKIEKLYYDIYGYFITPEYELNMMSLKNIFKSKYIELHWLPSNVKNKDIVNILLLIENLLKNRS